jgi:hypothetical protein
MFSWPLGVSSFKFFLDLFLSKPDKLVEDLDFFGLWSAVPFSEGGIFPESDDFSFNNDLSDILLFVFLCIVGLVGSSFIGTRRAWGGLLMCRSPSGVSEPLVAGLWVRTLDGSFSLFFLPRKNCPTDVVRL